MRKSLATGALLVGMCGCGQSVPAITSTPVTEAPAKTSAPVTEAPAITSTPVTAVPAIMAKDKTVAELPVQDRIEALARIPTMRTQRLNAIIDALALRHPDEAESLDEIRKRLLALDQAQVKALRASLWQGMKDRTVEDVHLEFLAMIDKPAKLTSLLDAKLDAIEILNDKGIKALGATLPVEMERLETFETEVVRAFVARVARKLGQTPGIAKP
ncbi:MAG: hypothetical protein VKP57_05085 [Candidatus Sericytochromatia bacterium]|nr:hypothetical protein [Candidatus Sericytochromatia bacterium]